VYKKSSLVEQIWVYGNSFENSLVGVVVPNEDALKSWVAQSSLEGDFAAICRDQRTKEYLSSELAQTAKAGRLKVLCVAFLCTLGPTLKQSQRSDQP
jgi:long-chain acyl-CoA synthetase